MSHHRNNGKHYHERSTTKYNYDDDDDDDDDDDNNNYYNPMQRYDEQRNEPVSGQPYYEEQRQTVMENEHEEEYNKKLMQEREAEILEINKKMHTVDEIYKDLAKIVVDQQDLIDNIDTSIDVAHAHAKDGMGQIEDARLYKERAILDDPFGDKLIQTPTKANDHHRGRRNSSGPSKKRKGRKKRRPKKETENRAECLPPLESMKGNLDTVVNDLQSLSTKLFGACVAPNTNEEKEYTKEYTF